MSEDTLTLLDACRSLANVPFVVTSSIRCVAHNHIRCVAHNHTVGGADRSAHITGHAVDVKAIDSHTRHKILNAAFRLKVPRIGIARTFIHLDNSPHLSAGVVWLYANRT